MNNRLDRAIGPTPERFSRRIDQTLLMLKEEKDVKRLTVRTVALTALLLALLGGMAYAAITYGMEWYYNNRFTAYQQYEPEKYEALMHGRQKIAEQQTDGDALVQVRVEEAAWLEEERFLSIILTAAVQDNAQYELHPMWNLDADGAYAGEAGSELPQSDGEDRAVHWLWTARGFGPVKTVMEDETKELLLFEADSIYIETEEGITELPGEGSVDAFVGENGEVVTVLEAELGWLDEEFDAQAKERMLQNPDMAKYWQQRMKEAAALRAALQANNGKAVFHIPYTVTRYTDDDAMLYGGGEEHALRFEMKIP